ncbi:transposase family protein [Thorsellia anophelis]|uniref:DDE_Tnp_1-associated n=1 Tax=Thorsellia anophelis DSM 18579 TaxID=1123402 RepID=A0A1I0AL37_9GAMM|nr:transposase family protein [Thorsellia anophelis]SES95071.1 DDE_Tnp_1-associated [Thorsellia anophelis DSM 18579]
MSIITVSNQITGPGKDINKKHDLFDVLFLTFSAVLSGTLGWNDIKQFGDEKLEWLSQFRDFKIGILVDNTIARVISCIKLYELGKCCRQENN